MNNFSHIWFVDSHSECYCGNDTLARQSKTTKGNQFEKTIEPLLTEPFSR